MRLSLTKPTSKELLALIRKYEGDELTYKNIGVTESWSESTFAKLPSSNVVDGDLLQCRRVKIGRGHHDYRSATDAIRRALCFDVDWIECEHDGDLNTGDVFSLMTRAFGIWTVSFCKVVYVHQEDTDTGKLFSLGLGTLPCHAASGEERFSIAWDYSSDEVHFLIGSFSRPQTLLAKVFVWYLRNQQNRFASESADRIRQEVEAARDTSTFADQLQASV